MNKLLIAGDSFKSADWSIYIKNKLHRRITFYRWQSFSICLQSPDDRPSVGRLQLPVGRDTMSRATVGPLSGDLWHFGVSTHAYLVWNNLELMVAFCQTENAERSKWVHVYNERYEIMMRCLWGYSTTTRTAYESHKLTSFRIRGSSWDFMSIRDVLRFCYDTDTFYECSADSAGFG